MKKILYMLIIIGTIVGVGFFVTSKEAHENINVLETSEIGNEEIQTEEELAQQKETKTEEELIQSVRDKHNIYLVKDSEFSANYDYINSILKEGEKIIVAEDEDYIEILNMYNDYEIDENYSPIVPMPIKCNNKATDKVLLNKYANEIFDGKTKAKRIAEIAKEDSNIEYLATIDDGYTEIPFEEVPDNMHFTAFATNVDVKGNIKCICYFEP